MTTITYQPEIARALNDRNAAILLNQINYWFNKSGNQPFYKFRVPCKNGEIANPDHRKGDSWTEELFFGVREFDTALEKIGTKINTNVSKSKILQHKVAEFDEYGQMKNIKNLVMYWTDNGRNTHYELNVELYQSLVMSCQNSKSELLLKKRRVAKTASQPSQNDNAELPKRELYRS